ncbi:MAG: hypothetical protein QOG03_1371, partial [Actinomycetota bacterium]|jgi:hypothetical protein|nr:hypothetical protein [Actinomycetota bacterium]
LTIAAAVAAVAGLVSPALGRPYVAPPGDLTSVNCGGATAPDAPSAGGVCYDIPADKHFAAITITDTHGQPTTGEYYFRDATATNMPGTEGFLCGNRTVAIPAGAVRITVYVTASNQAQACGLAAVPGTTGTVDVSFLTDHTFNPVVPGTTGAGSPNVQPVANVPYSVVSGWPWPGGTDLEFADLTYQGTTRKFAIAGSYQNGMHLVDISTPTAPNEVAVYDCRIYQADVQVFTRGARSFVAYGIDDYSRTDPGSKCFTDLGLGTTTPVLYGTLVIEVTDPAAPKSVGFLPFAQGSHNTTIHPGGRYLYSSNADLPGVGTVEVFDLQDFANPQLVSSVLLPGSLPSHDVTFSADGSRAYVAALSATYILDTTNPADPKPVGRIVDPTINIHHQADPVTLTDPVLGTRTFLLVTDEIAGAEGNGACPGGGIHVFDITGPLEAAPVKVGFFSLPEVSQAKPRTRCTAHVMRIYPDQKLLTIAWYASGVHVLDLSSLVGVSVGNRATGSAGAGIKQVGWFAYDVTDTWSVKAPADRFEPDGSFYMYANDQLRGFDVYRYDATAPKATQAGVWLTAAQAKSTLRTRSGPYQVSCILRTA